MAGSRPPSVAGHLASWFHLTGNLLSSQPVIPQSHYRRRKKTLIQSLSLYLKKTDFQPHHRRCLFKKHRRSFWGCASFISHVCCCFSLLVLLISNWQRIDCKRIGSAFFCSAIFMLAQWTWTEAEPCQTAQPRLKCLWTAAACRREVTKSQSLSVNT